MTVLRNPLNYWCTPNQATPDYVSYRDFRSWLAYGLMSCWFSSDPQDPNADCAFSRPVTTADVQELRGYFLDLVETVIVALWEDAAEPDEQGWLEKTGGDLLIDLGPADIVSAIVSWNACLRDDTIMFELSITGCDPECIFLDYEALDDRQEVLQVLTEARQHVRDQTVYAELVRLAGEAEPPPTPRPATEGDE